MTTNFSPTFHDCGNPGSLFSACFNSRCDSLLCSMIWNGHSPINRTWKRNDDSESNWEIDQTQNFQITHLFIAIAVKIQKVSIHMIHEFTQGYFTQNGVVQEIRHQKIRYCAKFHGHSQAISVTKQTPLIRMTQPWSGRTETTAKQMTSQTPGHVCSEKMTWIWSKYSS